MEAKAANTNSKSVFKILVLGGINTGQSCLVSKFVHGIPYEFDYYEPTIENNSRKQIHVNKKEITLDICDIGQDPFGTFLHRLIRSTDGVLITYGINDHYTFEEAKKFYDEIVRIKGDDQTPSVITLCGTKCDKEDERRVSTQEGQELAQQMGALFFETSVVTNYNVDNVFIETAKKIMEVNDHHEPTKTPKSFRERIGDLFSSIFTPKK